MPAGRAQSFVIRAWLFFRHYGLGIRHSAPRLRFRFGQDRLHPGLVVQIPPDGLANAVLEFVRGRPAQFALDFRCVNGVAAVVAEPVFDKCNQLARIAAELRRKLVNGVANQLDDAEVGPFVVAADVVSLAVAPARERQPERLRVLALN